MPDVLFENAVDYTDFAAYHSVRQNEVLLPLGWRRSAARAVARPTEGTVAQFLVR